MPRHTAAFINLMSIEMKDMALRAKFFDLAFILDMASLEASLRELSATASEAKAARKSGPKLATL